MKGNKQHNVTGGKEFVHHQENDGGADKAKITMRPHNQAKPNRQKRLQTSEQRCKVTDHARQQLAKEQNMQGQNILKLQEAKQLSTKPSKPQETGEGADKANITKPSMEKSLQTAEGAAKKQNRQGRKQHNVAGGKVLVSTKPNKLQEQTKQNSSWGLSIKPNQTSKRLLKDM